MDEFVALHAAQLSGYSGAQKRAIYEQLSTGELSAGSHVIFSNFAGAEDEEEEHSRLHTIAKHDWVKGEEDVVLVCDHAFSFHEKQEALDAFEQVQILKDRVVELLQLEEHFHSNEDGYIAGTVFRAVRVSHCLFCDIMSKFAEISSDM